ncbi:uncharacterized protein LOC143019932 isoform X3 [Oratosquilla oratoria]|uniref:uncharacterized protein LOC143019932 isoform X3 n=1 Tax=Oratosquilla oratoria TaxID=337810 RepID=UPI003F76392B
MQPPYIGHRLLHTTKFKFWYPAIMDFENDDYLDFSDDDLICTSRDAISSDDETDAQILRFPSKGVKRIKRCIHRSVKGQHKGGTVAVQKKHNLSLSTDFTLTFTNETQNKLTEIKKSTEDEFECEMMKELSSTMEEATSFAKSNSGTKIEKEMVKMDDKDESQCYDDVYFDSDEEDGEDQANQRRLCSNDELLYDPKMDEQDQLWVDKRRRSYQVKKKNRLNPDEPQLLPQSDAVLNCPACLTTLCLDCQRLWDHPPTPRVGGQTAATSPGHRLYTGGFKIKNGYGTCESTFVKLQKGKQSEYDAQKFFLLVVPLQQLYKKPIKLTKGKFKDVMDLSHYVHPSFNHFSTGLKSRGQQPMPAV